MQNCRKLGYIFRYVQHGSASEPSSFLAVARRRSPTPRSSVTRVGAPKEVGMDAKKKQAESEELYEKQQDVPEFEVPEEMEAWGLDDLSDLVPTTFD